MNEVITQAQVQRARERYNLFLRHRADLEKSFLLIGMDILEFYENETWKYLGHQSFEDFCEAPIESAGCNLASYRSAMRYASVYRRYVRELRCEENRLLDVGITKLELMIPYVNADNKIELLEQGKMQSRADLQNTLRQRPDFIPDPPKHAPLALHARPILLWQYDEAPIQYKNLYVPSESTENWWIGCFPPEVAAVSETTHIMGAWRDESTKMILLDHSEVFLFK